MLICLFIFKTATYFKAVGALTALWIGYIIEDKYIKYETGAIWWKQIIKFIIGFSGLILIRVYIKKILPESIYSDFIRYALMGIWMTVIAPIIYRGSHLEKRISD